MKRRIVCDETPLQCQKCLKKGLKCPGYGVRYRFSDVKTAPFSTLSNIETSSSNRRGNALRWIDVRHSKNKKGSKRRELVENQEPKSGPGIVRPGSRLQYDAKIGSTVLQSTCEGSAYISSPPPDRPDDISRHINPTNDMDSILLNNTLLTTTLPPLLAPLDPKMRFLFDHCKTIAYSWQILD